MTWILIAVVIAVAGIVVLAVSRAAGMADEAMERGASNHESGEQERTNALAWLVFHAIAIWSSVWRWLTWKRVCSWHKPGPRHMGGNPLGWKTTNGICSDCFARISHKLSENE